jgi:hypothetical protein
MASLKLVISHERHTSLAVEALGSSIPILDYVADSFPLTQ